MGKAKKKVFKTYYVYQEMVSYVYCEVKAFDYEAALKEAEENGEWEDADWVEREEGDTTDVIEMDDNGIEIQSWTICGGKTEHTIRNDVK